MANKKTNSTKNSRKGSKSPSLRSKSRFSKFNFLLVVLIFAAIGGYVLLRSFAASVPQTIHNNQWHCTSRQDSSVVNVTMDRGMNMDAVHIDSGCTGVLTVNVTDSSRDCMKIHTGAHDLTIYGRCTMLDREDNSVHQDGVQALGGVNVTLKNFIVTACPGAPFSCAGRHGSDLSPHSLFINAGAGGNSNPDGIVCDHCQLDFAGMGVEIGNSKNSGAVDSKIQPGTQGCVHIGSSHDGIGAVNPVNTNNQCLSGIAPTVNLSASPNTVPKRGTSKLTWSSSNADSCRASGDWDGTQATHGTVTTVPLKGTATFTLTCTGAGGSSSATQKVKVSL